MKSTAQIPRVCQNCMYTPYMTVYWVISLPKILYIHHLYVWFWPTYRYPISTHSRVQPWARKEEEEGRLCKQHRKKYRKKKLRKKRERKTAQKVKHVSSAQHRYPISTHSRVAIKPLNQTQSCCHQTTWSNTVVLPSNHLIKHSRVAIKHLIKQSRVAIKHLIKHRCVAIKHLSMDKIMLLL